MEFPIRAQSERVTREAAILLVSRSRPMLSHGQEADNFTSCVFPIARAKDGETIGTCNSA